MKLIDDTLIHELQSAARTLPRGRKNHNIHPELGDPVQRLLNALEPGSYVRPHRHTTPPKWELFIILTGHAAILTFDDQGKVLKRVELNAAGPVRGVEIPAGAWHTLLALAAGTVVFESKPGPYCATIDKDFASWAPTEGTPESITFQQRLASLQPGQRL